MKMSVRIAFLVAIVGLAVGWMALRSENSSLEEKVAKSGEAGGAQP